jgi:hypothetical protein
VSFVALAYVLSWAWAFPLALVGDTVKEGGSLDQVDGLLAGLCGTTIVAAAAAENSAQPSGSSLMAEQVMSPRMRT